MKWVKSLYFWVAMAFVAGSSIGLLYPSLALLFEPLGVQFIKIVKLFVGPIIFFTIASGIAHSGTLKKLGGVGLKAFIYFEIVSTLALGIGWMVGLIFHPGSYVHANLNNLDITPAKHFIAQASNQSFLAFLEAFIPNNIIEPFLKGNILQVVMIALIFGISLLAIDQKKSKPILDIMEGIILSLFYIIRLVMYLAPVGVFGAMAYTLAKFGGDFLLPLFGLVLVFYFTAFLFVFVILGCILRAAGFSIFSFLSYIWPELLLILGTSSSESALPQLLFKLEALGCKRETLGLVVPIGYSFNLDGTNIYITLAALFIAQALDIELSFTQELALFLTAMLSSKGAAGITGAGFITLAATLSVVPIIPVGGIVLVLGIDRFMSEVRALVNYIGNGVGAIVVSRWEGELPNALFEINRVRRDGSFNKRN